MGSRRLGCVAPSQQNKSITLTRKRRTLRAICIWCIWFGATMKRRQLVPSLVDHFRPGDDLEVTPYRWTGATWLTGESRPAAVMLPSERPPQLALSAPRKLSRHAIMLLRRSIVSWPANACIAPQVSSSALSAMLRRRRRGHTGWRSRQRRVRRPRPRRARG